MAVTTTAPGTRIDYAATLDQRSKMVILAGAVLTASLTAALATSLAPIQAQLPPAIVSQLDPAALRNGGGGGESVPGQPADPAARIEAALGERFGARRDLLTRALGDADPTAIAVLAESPETPAQLKELLGNVGGMPAPAREQALARALAALDEEEARARAQGAELGAEISRAVKVSFTDSITAIYRYAIGLALVALILAFFLPELPLRRGREEPPVIVE